MRTTRLAPSTFDLVPEPLREGLRRRATDLAGYALIGLSAAMVLALATWSVRDPSLSHAIHGPVTNLLGAPGAIFADLAMQIAGLGAVAMVFGLALLGRGLVRRHVQGRLKLDLGLLLLAVAAASGLASALPKADRWPLPSGMGGALGDGALRAVQLVGFGGSGFGRVLAALLFTAVLVIAWHLLARARPNESEPQDSPETMASEDEESSRFSALCGGILHAFYTLRGAARRAIRSIRPRSRVVEPAAAAPVSAHRREPAFDRSPASIRHEPPSLPDFEIEPDTFDEEPLPTARVAAPTGALKPGKRASREAQTSIFDGETYQLPPLSLLAEPKRSPVQSVSTDALEQNARLLEGVLDDFGVRGEIINVRPGPVVTLYELEPAPGTKSSRVIGLAEDIARSMSAVAARVAVVPGRNAIGIELPNAHRETVLLRELLASEDFEKSKLKLAICLGKTIGGEPVIVDLARMPHLLVAGTTGSGKSVAINTMICSLLYRLRPEECRLIMIDPKMLELSVYDGIPHLLSPVVTDPKKAVVALKWAVREMEDRYRKMSKLGVRNIDGYNARMDEARERGEALTRSIQSGYDRETGEALFEEEVMAPEKLPYIVVIVDEMADLMIVAGKEIEGAVQRLAQMARAAGIHIVMATQRPSVDVITGTIKANFPTRISFQVTSKIDSRTILGEQGAEQLLGQGDMLYMAGGGRISRVHGPFVADGEVEKVVDLGAAGGGVPLDRVAIGEVEKVVEHLKRQGRPNYVEAVTADLDGDGEDDDGAVFDKGDFGDESADLYDQAVAIVLRDKKASTSYVQRRLQIGYNRAASIIERMEREGIVGPANHAGKREILLRNGERGDGDDDA